MHGCYSSRTAAKGLVNKSASAVWLGLTCGLTFLAISLARGEARAAERPAWTTSRVTGLPDPAPPYRTEHVYPELTFKQPVTIARLPGTNRILIMQLKDGIESFEDEADVAQTDPFFDFAANIKDFWRAYGIAFHPQYAENRYCFVCYVLKRGLEDGSRVSRFKVSDTDPPYLIPESEEILLTWPSGGHNGGSIQFGADGYLYISTGDGSDPVPPDIFRTGQNLGDFRSKILRIDVDGKTGDLPYGIPADNPFVQLEGAKPEVWAYGVRNPWKMAFDPTGKELWLGDVGWEMWEQIHRIERGGNYGWSVMEASQPIHPESRRGPTAINPPIVALSRSESLSVTGGVFYQGKQLPELQGAYTYGDFITGTIWALKTDGKQLAWNKVLALTTHEIIDFGRDKDGELLVLDHGGTIHRLVKNEVADNSQDFPRKLSETGLFQSVEKHELAAGIAPYQIQAPVFADGATSVRFLALPGVSQIKLDPDRAKWEFPPDAVLGKTISLELEKGKASSARRLETQLMHFDGIRWNGYTYAWNDEQSDAELVSIDGEQRSFEVKDVQAPGGSYRQVWHFQSRNQCGACHNRRVNFTVAFDPMQLSFAAANKSSDQSTPNQIDALLKAGFMAGEETPTEYPLCDPYNAEADITHRALSYLHTNCAHCHRHGGGGNAQFKLQYDFDRAKAGYIGTRPVVGTFNLPRPEVVAAGDPYRSTLYYRMAKLGGGRMPHIGASQVDQPGLDLIHDWIAQIQPMETPASADAAASPSEPTLLEEQADAALKIIVSTIPVGKNVSKEMSAETEAACQTLTSTTTGALRAVYAIDHQFATPQALQKLIDLGPASTDPNIRDLFERYLPEEKRVKRLGNIVDARQMLQMKGCS